MPATPSRRALLRVTALGAVGALVAACTDDEPAPSPAPPTPDEHARSAGATLETRLEALARTTFERHPSLDVAAAAAAAHRSHAQALAGAHPVAPLASPGPTAPAVPKDRRTATRVLARAQQAAADEHRAALEAEGVSGEVARLLASVAGSDDAFAARLLRTSS